MEHKSKHLFRRLMAGVYAAFLLSIPVFAADKQTVLIIFADDATFSELPLYGGQNLKMPAMDKLAWEGKM